MRMVDYNVECMVACCSNRSLACFIVSYKEVAFKDNEKTFLGGVGL